MGSGADLGATGANHACKQGIFAEASTKAPRACLLNIGL